MADHAATGKVVTITTNRDGTTDVTIQDKKKETFRHPGDMTDNQLEAFKRAQDLDRVVGVEWNGKDGPRPVQSVIVSPQSGSSVGSKPKSR